MPCSTFVFFKHAFNTNAGTDKKWGESRSYIFRTNKGK